MTLLKKVFLAQLTCLVTYSGFAQLKPVYLFQKDDTVLKRNYYNRSVQVKDAEMSAVKAADKEVKEQYKKIYEQRLEEMKDLLLTSRSVTDAKAHNYLQSVLSKIVAANPELKEKDIRLVFTRDWWPNAYSTGDGTLAINAGLMMYLDNEAELVFVLSHELAHYYLDHTGKAIKKYMETVNGDEFKAEMKRISKLQFKQNEAYDNLFKKAVFNNRRHSRDKEAEADKWALKFLHNTGYDANGIRTALQKLDTLDEAAFIKRVDLKQFLTFEDYPFKDKWIKEESSIFSKLNEDDVSGLTQKERDSLKSHPDCLKRIDLLKDSIDKVKGKFFLSDETVFNQLRKDFKAEIVEQCFVKKNISRHLYYCFQMIDDPLYRPMAILGIARDLNSIYEAQKNHQLGTTIDEENRYYAKDYNLLLRLLSRIRLDELLAVNYFFCKKYGEEMKDYAGFSEEVKRLEKNRN